MNDTKNSPPSSPVLPNERTQRGGLGFSIALAGLMVVLLVAVAIGLPRLLAVVNPPTQLATLSPQAAEMTQQLAERRARDAAQLASYGWVDKASGLARIPIEQAIAVIAAQGLPVGAPPVQASAPVSETTAIVDLTNLTYHKDILPIFEQHCGKCHGTDNPEEGLTLTDYKSMMNGSLNGSVISPGDPDKSYLVEMVVSGKMPKRGGPLPQADIDRIIAWIQAGAPEGEASVSVAVSAPLTATTALTESVNISETAPLTETTIPSHTVDLANVSFTNDVLPIFMAHCSKCHGDDQPEEGLELTSYKKLMNGSLNGGVIAKGDPDNSYLVEMIVKGKMPKRGGPLPQSDIDTIIAWIKAGAIDDTGITASITATATASVALSATVTPTEMLTATETTTTTTNTVATNTVAKTPTPKATASPTATPTIIATEAITPAATITASATVTSSSELSVTEATTHSVDLANVSFSNDVLPIFMAHCSKCHGDDQPEEGLELTSYKKLMNGSLNGGVIAKGDPDNSYLVEMIVSGKMPKRGGLLAQSDIDTIIAWIKAGAIDDTGKSTEGAASTVATPVITATVSMTATLSATSAATKAAATATPTAVATKAATLTSTPKATATSKATNTTTVTPTIAATLKATATKSAVQSTATVTTSNAITATTSITTAAVLSSTGSTTATVDFSNVSFSNDVLPIFMAHCSKCHGDDNPEEGLELTSYKKIMNGSLNGGVVKKGDPENSYLVEMITTGKMPKRGGPLAQSDIDTIVAWIQAGAEDN